MSAEPASPQLTLKSGSRHEQELSNADQALRRLRASTIRIGDFTTWNEVQGRIGK